MRAFSSRPVDECPNCGNRLVYCIDNQTLKCLYCCNRYGLSLVSENCAKITMDKYIELAQKAALFAGDKHKRQKYGEGEFIQHPAEVSKVLQSAFNLELGENQRILVIAAWLHDVLEDTDTTMETLVKEFGEEVANLVFAVTNEPGKNRKECWVNTAKKIRSHPLGVHLKLADRIANVSASIRQRSDLLGMYLKEDEMFYAELNGQLSPLWSVYGETMIAAREEMKKMQEAK